MKNAYIQASFENSILSVTLLDNVVVTAEDLMEIYAFANDKAKGSSYGVLFEAVNHYKVTEPAIEYMVNNPNNIYVLAKAYVVNTAEADAKTKFHLLFDKPQLRPFTFKTRETALKWLRSIVDNANG